MRRTFLFDRFFRLKKYFPLFPVLYCILKKFQFLFIYLYFYLYIHFFSIQKCSICRNCVDEAHASSDHVDEAGISRGTIFKERHNDIRLQILGIYYFLGE